MINRKLDSTNSGVKISFSGDVKKGDIIKMVENCSYGKCDCMSSTTKEKIKDMSVDGVDGDVNLTLTGDISKDEIANALKNSKVVN